MITNALLSNVQDREQIMPSWYTRERYAYCEQFTVEKNPSRMKNLIHRIRKGSQA